MHTEFHVVLVTDLCRTPFCDNKRPHTRIYEYSARETLVKCYSRCLPFLDFCTKFNFRNDRYVSVVHSFAPNSNTMCYMFT